MSGVCHLCYLDVERKREYYNKLLQSRYTKFTTPNHDVQLNLDNNF